MHMDWLVNCGLHLAYHHYKRSKLMSSALQLNMSADCRNKRGISIGLLAVYIVVLIFYIALSLTGAFAFQHVFDVYTLNFLHDETSASLFYAILNHFLTLFPVFTLTTNYPIVANTLNNNLTVLFEMINLTITTWVYFLIPLRLLIMLSWYSKSRLCGRAKMGILVAYCIG